MEIVNAVDWLRQKGIKPTANRILVLKALSEQPKPVALSDLEKALDTMDKSSIFRVLTLFMEHDAVHAFEDGRGVMQYELCTQIGICNHTDDHFHFYCISCRRSFCLENVEVPSVCLPIGFVSYSVSFVIKGECADCRRKHQNNR